MSISKIYELAQDHGYEEIINYLDTEIEKKEHLSEKEQLKDYWLHSELEYPQFIVIDRNKTDEQQLVLNTFAEEGYKLHSITPHEGIGRTNWRIVMYLDVGYKNVTNLADVKPQDVDLYLINGWEIASTSISTKFVRMILREGRGVTETGSEGVE